MIQHALCWLLLSVFFVSSNFASIAINHVFQGHASPKPFILSPECHHPFTKPKVREVRKTPVTRTRNRLKKTIIIDPGHGGVYLGQVSINGKLIEKNVVLKLAKDLATKLRARGYNVILTRTSDVEFDKKDLLNDLACRAQFSRTYKADIFVSLHLNGSTSKTIRGYEVYVPYETKFPIKSYTLAASMHYELSHKIKPIFAGGSLGNLNNIDHGIKASKFNVLTRAQCAAVLVELDYLTNAESERMLSTPWYQETLVNAVYWGIRRYFER